MSLRKIPVLIALAYICDSARLKLTYEEGIWKVENFSNEVGMDLIQVRIEGMADKEYQALGLKKDTELGLITADGKKWPSGPNESCRPFKNLLILRASRSKIDDFNALLHLHRSGYKVPKINSNHSDKE